MLADCHLLKASGDAALGNSVSLRSDNLSTDWVVYTNKGAAQEAEVMTCGFDVLFGDGPETWTPNIPDRFGLAWIDLVFGNGGGKHDCRIDVRNGTLISIPAQEIQARVTLAGRSPTAAEPFPDLAIQLRVKGSCVRGTRGGIYAPTHTLERIQLGLIPQVVRIPPFASKLLIYSDSAAAYTQTYQFLTGPLTTDYVLNAASTLVDPNAGDGSGLQIPGVARYLALTGVGEQIPAVWPCFLLDL